MYKLAVILLSGMLACGQVQSAAPACHAKVADEIRLSEQYQYEVAGSGRLYFHTAPNASCTDKHVFVVPGDRLVAYSESGAKSEWTSVMYVAKNGQDYSGWVRTERLRFTGAFGANMTPESMKFYEKAAKEAKAGKLGAP